MITCQKYFFHFSEDVRTFPTVACICHQISRSFLQNAWDIRIRAEIFLRRKQNSNFDPKKFRLFRANRVVLYVLTKEPHFLIKTRGIFSIPRYSYFFHSHKKRESLLYFKNLFYILNLFFRIKKKGIFFFNGNLFYVLKKVLLFSH